MDREKIIDTIEKLSYNNAISDVLMLLVSRDDCSVELFKIIANMTKKLSGE